MGKLDRLLIQAAARSRARTGIHVSVDGFCALCDGPCAHLDARDKDGIQTPYGLVQAAYTMDSADGFAALPTELLQVLAYENTT